MKIAVLTVYQIYANKVVKELLYKFGNDIVLIAESGVLLQNKSLLKSLVRYARISGVYYILVQALKLEIFKVMSFFYSLFGKDRDNKFYSYRVEAKKNKIGIYKVEDANSVEFKKEIKNNKIDVLVSVFFNQILKPDIIKIPKKGVINIHPAYLPDYKGVGPVFWALANGEKTSGVSVHYLNEGIDTGGIIKRSKIRIEKKDTEDSLYWKAVLVGSPLLISSIEEIMQGSAKTVPNKGGRYFSLPSKEAIKKFKKMGRRFFKIIEYIFRN